MNDYQCLNEHDLSVYASENKNFYEYYWRRAAFVNNVFFDDGTNVCKMPFKSEIKPKVKKIKPYIHGM